MPKKIYLDYASSTPIDKRVHRVMSVCSKNNFGNASSMYQVGRQAKKTIDKARQKISGVLKSRPEEIIFTGSGTEANNLAIFGIARAYQKYGKRILISNVEHHSVLRACEYLEKNEGFKIDYVKADKDGQVQVKEIAKMLKPDTILASIIYANNEIGTIQPIAEIAKILRNFRRAKFKEYPLFHSDACQAAGYLNLNTTELGIDLMTLNSSKIYGPKGIGCLFLKRGTDLVPLIYGGDQENGKRAGTQSQALIAGFARALEIVNGNKNKKAIRLLKLRNYFISKILNTVTHSRLNGHPTMRLPNNINISFEGIDGEMLVLMLDKKDVQVSTGSACTAVSNEPSHVIKALCLPEKFVRGNIRLTLGNNTSRKDLDYVSKILPPLIEKLRNR